MTVTTIFTLMLAYIAEQLEPKHHQKWDWNKFVFNGVRCYFGFSCTYNPTNNVCRVGYAFVLFGGIIYATAFTALVIKLILIRMYEPQINSVQEFIDGRFSLVGNHIASRKIKVSYYFKIFMNFDI